MYSFNGVYDIINEVLIIKNENKKVEIISKLRIDNLKRKLFFVIFLVKYNESVPA